MTIKLLLVPDQENYTVDDNDAVVQTKVDGGPARYRLDYLGSSMQVETTWTLNPDEYQYFRAFYNYCNKGADPFLCDLIIDAPELRTYVCRFKSNTFKLNRVRGSSYTVKCTLEVTPNDAGLDYAAIVEDYVAPVYEAPPAPIDWGLDDPWVDP